MSDAGFIDRWTGLEGLGDEALAEILPQAIAAVEDAGNLFVGELKTTLTGARSGRPYKVSKRGPLHTASAPGEAPAVLFGALRNSIGEEDVRVVDGVSVETNVGVGLGVVEGSSPGGIQPPKANEVAPNYAARLEFGGVDQRGVRILPRPYMAPTVLRVTPLIDALFAERVGSK